MVYLSDMSLFSSKIYFLSVITLIILPALVEGKIKKAVAVIHPIEGNAVQGKVTFTLEKKGIRLIADVQGLTPGEHGFHIHEFGDCGSEDGASAGGHFNPTHKQHGCPNSSERHVGDLGNIVANNQGYAHLDVLNKEIKFEGKNNIIGRSIIIHSDPDDCASQPTGNSGARIGCGVIGIDNMNDQ
jgi:Cu-Zn family superoxide dismutase